MSWLDDFATAAHANLGEKEREALWARGVSDEQIELYQLGYMPRVNPAGSSEDFLEFCRKTLRASGFLEDVFVLPLTNILGQVKGFQFRRVAEEMRGYRTFYHDRDESVYFGLGQAIPRIWETETAFVVEGAFDVFPLQRVFPNTFAALTLGTSEALARLLWMFAKVVWLGYDNDKDGKRACEDFKVMVGDSLDVRFIIPPKVKKPDGTYTKDHNELWKAWGSNRYRDYVTQQTA